MNKTLINCLTIIIIAIVAIWVFMPMMIVATAFMEGSDSEPATEIVKTAPVEIALNPEPSTLLNPVDSLTFSDGNRYGIAIKSGIVMVPEDKICGPNDLISAICYFLNVIFFFVMAVQFVKFVININKGKIFVLNNVKRLRRVAYALFAMSICAVVAGVVDEINIDGMGLMLRGYSPEANWEMPWTTLLLGFISLLMSKVWIRGIELREESELTI